MTAVDRSGGGYDERLFPGRGFISTVLDLLDVKSQMSSRLWKIYLMRAAMAGMLIGLFYLTMYGIEAAFDQVVVGDGASLLPFGKVLGPFVFSFALVFIYFTKSELLTSNMMIASVGVYHQRSTWRRAGRILGLCYVGNLLGGLFLALLLMGSSLLDGSVGEFVGHSVEVKTAYITEGATGWGDLFVRAILCNFLINIGMLLCYNGAIKEDIAKVMAMVVSVFLFAYLGLEHSVANTCLFLMYGLQYPIDAAAALGNVAIALLGNFIGGGLLIGIYYSYANDSDRAIRSGHLPGQ